MSDPRPARHGGQILVDALKQHQVDTVYCVPGESYLPVLDALHDAPEIKLIVTRHEGAASNMADAYGKLTGRPGICFVTRGPGATHAANGVHTAKQDSTPMVLFVGQIDQAFREREAFQEVDYRKTFSDLAKWVTEIEDIQRIPEMVARAFQVASSGRPGPVVVALPEDILFAAAQVTDIPAVHTEQPEPPVASLHALTQHLTQAKRPLVIVGGTGWTDDALTSLRTFCHHYHLPVLASFRRQDLYPNDDDLYAGQVGLGLSPKLAERIAQSDLLLVIGSRLSESVTLGYTVVRAPIPTQPLIHVHPDPAELGRVYQPTLAIHAGLSAFGLALGKLPAPANVAWKDWTKQAREDYLAFSQPPKLSADYEGVDLAVAIKHVSDTLPRDAIIGNGAGNYTVWVHRFYSYRAPRTELAPTNGAMGYGFPAAVAAKLHAPERDVVCFAGDGCFMMYPQELATAMQYGAPLIVIVVNNGMLATIRMHQEREYPGRVSGTALANPDFVALAHAFGAHAERVERTEDFPAAFARARASGVAALIELRTDPRQLTPAARMA